MKTLSGSVEKMVKEIWNNYTTAYQKTELQYNPLDVFDVTNVFWTTSEQLRTAAPSQF